MCFEFPASQEATSILTSEPDMAQATPVTQIAVDDLLYKGQYCLTVPVNINLFIYLQNDVCIVAVLISHSISLVRWLITSFLYISLMSSITAQGDIKFLMSEQ